MMGTQVKERLKTKILVDGGDPEETRRMKSLLGFVDGQTTNPSLIAKNPEVQHRLATGHKFSLEEQEQEYKRIVQQISPLVGDGESRLKCSRISRPHQNKCLCRDRICFPGFPTLTSNIHARTKASTQPKCP